MLKKLNDFSINAYLKVKQFFGDLKNDEKGLSGVVVAVLLIVIAVLAIGMIWAALSGQLKVWWGQVTGESFEKGSL